MSIQSVSRRYAIALADVLTEEKKEAIVQEELSNWESMVSSNSQLQEVFANPTIPYNQKKRVLDELLVRTRVQPITANFLQILLKNQRLIALPQVNVKLREVLDNRAGVVAARVTTAKPINEDTKRMLSEKLSRHLTKSVHLSFAIDDSLIGGVVTQVGSTIYDASIRTELDEMERVLTS